MAKKVTVPGTYNVPHNWVWVELGEYVSVLSGYPFQSDLFSDNAEGRRPLIRIRDVIAGKTSTYTSEDCPDDYIIHNGDCLIGMDGDFNIAKWQSGDALLNQRVCFIKSNSDKLLNDYMFYFLPDTLRKINEATPSVTVKHLSTKTINIIKIPLPPLQEQYRIVERIESLFSQLEEARDKAQEALDSFENRKAAILQAAFSGKLIQTEAKGLIPLTEIAEEIRIGPFGSALHKEDYIVDGIPVINPKHIVNQAIVADTKVTISEDKAKELSSYRVKENDIILGRRGEMGRSAPVQKEHDGWLCGTGSMIIRLKKGYNAVFYSQIIASEPSVRYLEENAVGSTMSNLNEKIIKKLPVPDYSTQEQNIMMGILSKLIEEEKSANDVLEQVVEQIDSIKKSILAKAFRGELGTNDPEDECAIELIKSII